MMLGCCSNFLRAMLMFSFECSFVLVPNEWIAVSKKFLNELTSLDSSEIISPFCASYISGKVVTL